MKKKTEALVSVFFFPLFLAEQAHPVVVPTLLTFQNPKAKILFLPLF